MNDTSGARSELPSHVLDALLEGCQVIGPDFRYLYVNEAVARHGQTTREALLGRTMMEAYPGIERTPLFSTLRECMAGRQATTLENEFQFPDGSTGWFELRIEPVPEGLVILSMDISERKRAEAELHRTMRALRTLSGSNQTLVRALDEQRYLQDVYRLVVDVGEYDAAWIELIADDGAVQEVARAEGRNVEAASVPLVFELAVEEQRVGRLHILLGPDVALGEVERGVLDEIALDLAYGIDTLRSRAAHRSAEQQLFAARRLEAVGRLAGGIAHDFNNLVSVVLSYGEFVLDELAEGSPLRGDVMEILEAGRRASALTRQLLAFSKRQPMERQVVDPNEVVDGVERMIRRVFSANIELKLRLAPDLGSTLVDPGQLEQVLMNLAVNARDAMSGGGRLLIATENVELDESMGRAHPSGMPGRYVRITVADTGEGMTEEVMRKIFEPFFTTKETGRGTGLGLAMAYGIIQQSGGFIWAQSQPGEGTTITVDLPRVDAPAGELGPPLAQPVPKGTERILLVEDEPSVRAAALRILEGAGYRVSTAEDGLEALSVYERESGAFELVLTDVVMPRLGGTELVERLHARAPDLPVLFMSGYTGSYLAHHGALSEGTHFINKPFSAGVLAAKVRAVLDDS